MDRKKILVFSDTHGNVQALKYVLNWAKDRMPPKDSICAAAFLGDGIADLQPAANATGFYCEWKIIGGNNDYGYSMPETAVYDFCERRFFLCHGHRHGVYDGWHHLTAAARVNQADVVLFGHAHVPFFKNVDGVLLINPGSVGNPRSRAGASFAVIECAPEKPPEVKFWGIGARGEIKQLDNKNIS
jgi:putative phosphoesterase